MPVNLIKLMAFAFGAAIAALTGTLFASLNASVFPLTFSFPLLITVYTMVILGGQGNMAGVTVGAVLVSVLLELLRDPGDARILFYLFGVLALLFAFGKTRKLALVLGAIARLRLRRARIAGAINDDWISGPLGKRTRPRAVSLDHHPDAHGELARPGHVHRPDRARPHAHAPARLGAIHPARADVYLGTFVWENVLLAQPDATRYIVLGVMLIVLMIVRPNGLFGERRVEIV